jgi:hypothetical protein
VEDAYSRGVEQTFRSAVKLIKKSALAAEVQHGAVAQFG